MSITTTSRTTRPQLTAAFADLPQLARRGRGTDDRELVATRRIGTSRRDCVVDRDGVLAALPPSLDDNLCIETEPAGVFSAHAAHPHTDAGAARHLAASSRKEAQ